MIRAAVFVGLLFAAEVHAQEWTRFRGTNGSGVGSAVGLPTSWTAKDFEWTTKLPSRGHSSPVLWGDKIFITGADAKGARQVVCVDANTGVVNWTKSFSGDKYKMHARNSAATSTPTVDARHVYLLWGSPQETIVQALNHSGEQVWKIDLGPYHGNHGIGVSPIVLDDLLIIPNDQDKDGSLVALDSSTGQRRWSIPRESGSATYATPCVYQAADQPPRVIFTNWKHGMTAVDPKTGKVAWERSVFNPSTQERSIVSPIVAGDLILGTCGFTTGQKHFVAVRPTSDGKAEEVWRVEKGVPHMPTPIVYGDYIFIITEKGFASCLEAKTGRDVWQHRLDNEFCASPVCANGVIYAPADDGEVVVLKAAPVFSVLSRSPLGDRNPSTPAIAGNRMIFRTEQNLMALKAKP
jgi:outer membrane protein assembly factor BamB